MWWSTPETPTPSLAWQLSRMGLTCSFTIAHFPSLLCHQPHDAQKAGQHDQEPGRKAHGAHAPLPAGGRMRDEMAEQVIELSGAPTIVGWDMMIVII